MTWAFYLIASEIPPEEKHDHIARVWEWSGSALPEDHWALREEVLTGCSRWGGGVFANRWREVCGIVSAMIAWFSLPRPRRDALSDDAWGFAEWLAAGGLLQRRAFRHALLFLLFPASFEPVVVTGWKRQIVQGFARKWGEAPPANRDDLAVDRTLLRIRERLEADHSGEEIDFCRPPFEDVWRTDAARRPSSSSSGEAPAVSKGDDEAWFRKRFGDAEVWAIAPGAGARRWTDFQQRGIAAIDYEGVGDLSEYESLDDIRQAAAESGLGDNPINHSLAMWDFAHEMRVGDILVAKRGVRAILGWGTVRGSYVYDPDRTDFQHVREVEWHPMTKPVELPGTERFVVKTLTRWTRYREWVRRVFRLMEGSAVEPDGGAGTVRCGRGPRGRFRPRPPVHPDVGCACRAEELDPAGSAGGRQDVDREATRLVPDRTKRLGPDRDGAVPPIVCLRGLRARLAAERDRRVHAERRRFLRVLQAGRSAAGHAVRVHHRRNQPGEPVQDIR